MKANLDLCQEEAPRMLKFIGQTIEKHKEGQKDTRVTFIDLEKAYDQYRGRRSGDA